MGMIERCKQLPKPVFVLHVIARLLLGIGVGIFAAQYMPSSGWWVILAAVILALPMKYQLADKIREFSPRMFMLYMFTVIIFGIGLGVVWECALVGFGWYFLIAGLMLSIPGAYAMLKK